MIVKNFVNDSNRITMVVLFGLEKEFIKDGIFIRTFDNGWHIVGQVCEDYFTWVEKFTAYKFDGAKVLAGDYNKVIYASSEEAYNDFVKHFPPQEFDTYKI